MSIEAYYINTNGSRPNATLDIGLIKCWLFAIDFNVNVESDSERGKIEFHDEELYGWKGFVTTDGGKIIKNKADEDVIIPAYKEIEEELIKQTEKNGKAKYVVIFAHGGIVGVEDAITHNVDYSKNLATKTDHNQNRSLTTDYLRCYFRKDVIPAEKEEKKEFFQKKRDRRERIINAREIRMKMSKKKILTADEISFLIENRTVCETVILAIETGKFDAKNNPIYDRQEMKINISDSDIEKLKKGKTIDIDKKYDFNNDHFGGAIDEGAYDDQVEENTYNKNIKAEEKLIKETLTDVVLEDIASMKKIVECIDDDGYFLLATCHSAYTNGFLEYVQKLTDNRVNLIGIVGTAIVPLYNKNSQPGVGHFYAKRNIGLIETDVDKEQKKKNEILKSNGQEEIPILYNTFLSPSYHNNKVKLFKKGNAEPVTYKDVLIKNSKLELVN